MKEKENGLETYVNYATVDQLSNEAKTRSHNDTVIADVLNNLSLDCDENNEKNLMLLNNKQDKLTEKLTTKSKSIVEAINEINSKLETETNKFDTNEIIKSLKKVENLLETSIYTKFKEVTVDADTYLFEEYDENYWHMFVFEFESDNKKISGILERPSQLSSEVDSCNLIIDSVPTTSFNLIFLASSNILTIKDFDQQSQIINKISIYRKQNLN